MGFKSIIIKLYYSEIQRYRTTHYGYLALSIALFYIFILPRIIRTIWPYLITLTSNQNFYFSSILILNTVVHNTGYVFYYFVYTKKINLQKYRINPNKLWPWEKDRKEWDKLFWRSIKFITFNNYIFLPIIMIASIKYIGISYRFDEQSWPSDYEIITQLLFFEFCRQSLNYIIHSIEHLPIFYPYCHKVHHEYNIPIVINAQHFHPFQFILTSIIIYDFGASLLGQKVHMITIYLWYFMKIIQNIEDHCGYQFPWNATRILPGAVTNQYHDFHHTFNVGNIDTGGQFFDRLFNTNKEYYEYLCNRNKDVKSQ